MGKPRNLDTPCRAKDPATCRWHGYSDYDLPSISNPYVICSLTTGTEGGNPTVGSYGELGPDTLTQHTLPGGRLTVEREKVHRHALDKTFKDCKPAEGEKIFLVLGGGSASGKSSALKIPENAAPGTVSPIQAAGINFPTDRRAYVKVDSDEYKVELHKGDKGDVPMMKDDAPLLHEESSALAKRAVGIALKSGFHCLLDGTGDGSEKSMRLKVKAAHKAGYKVVGAYLTRDVEVCVVDAVKRGEKTGRYVSEKEIRNNHRKVSQILPVVAPMFDQGVLFDNYGDINTPPVVIATFGNGHRLTVVPGKEFEFQRFLDKANAHF